MWAMIGTCIALGIWTSGLLWVSVRAEKNRPRRELSEENVVETKQDEVNGIKAESGEGIV
jgi:hypothetical protein